MRQYLSLATFVCSTLLSFNSLASEAKAQNQKTIRWVLAHEPARVFERAARHFAAEVAKNSKGELKVEIIGLDGKSLELSPFEAFSKVKQGEVEMCQTYTTYLGHQSKDLWVLDLPFLFKNHQHATRVLDGAIGKQLLASLDSKGVKGLGFTYSGGYRVIPSQSKPLQSKEDFKDLKIKVTDSPVAQAYMTELGAAPVYLKDERHYEKGAEAYETTFARLPAIKDTESQYVNVTEHSLFLTSIIVNKAFFDSLTPAQQKIVSDAVAATAKLEREDSIKDNDDQRKRLEASKNVKVVEVAPQLRGHMQTVAQKIHQSYEGYFSKGLVAKIKAAE